MLILRVSLRNYCAQERFENVHVLATEAQRNDPLDEQSRTVTSSDDMATLLQDQVPTNYS